jgi:NosR/NirI family nitrous oxide reductase transcriptional regulator
VLRLTLLAVGIGLLALGLVWGQGDPDSALQPQLKSLFPDAVSFSAKEGSPPHFKALGPVVNGKPEVLGLAYWTTELEPLERAYDGPIKMLVGMDMRGVIVGIVVTEHREPYGYFSVDLPAFANQFEKKSVRDSFRVGDDIDAVTRATVSVTSASRAVRNSSRRIARAHLKPPEQ